MIAFLKALLAFISSTPELMKLIKNLQASALEEATNKKVKDDLKTINTAFANSDSKKLSDLFNNRVQPPSKTPDV